MARSLSRAALFTLASLSLFARAEEAAPMMMDCMIRPRMIIVVEYQDSRGERGTTLSPTPVVISTAKKRENVYCDQRLREA